MSVSIAGLLEDVRAMRVRGGNAFGEAAATAFRLVADDEAIYDPAALVARLTGLAEELLTLKPTMATIHNARLLIVNPLVGRQQGELAPLREELRIRADAYIGALRQAITAVGRAGTSLVRDGQTVMMHSFSASVISVFAAAQEAGTRFQVICTESRPLREGVLAADRLAVMGVPVTLVTDAAMSQGLRDADLVIVGADTISADGAVANKMGTAQLASLAARRAVPFYVAADRSKILPATAEGEPIVLERRPPDEVAAPNEFTAPDRVEVSNQFFDLTPPDAIRGFISDDGLHAPTNLAAAWEAWRDAFEVEVSRARG